MQRDPIFQQLPPAALPQIAKYLRWDPIVSDNPLKLLSKLPDAEALAWLDKHRVEAEDQVSWVGTPIFSYLLGNAKGYREIVFDLAQQLGTSSTGAIDTEDREAQIVNKLWKDTLDSLTPEAREELLRDVEAIATQYSGKVSKEFAGIAALTAAQASGFGVYLLGSTLLGAVNSALGLGLGFGVFTGLSSLISVVIGPVGWAALGLATVRKLGAANYKKLLPVVILIAAERAALRSAASEKATVSKPTSNTGTPVDVLPDPALSQTAKLKPAHQTLNQELATTDPIRKLAEIKGKKRKPDERGYRVSKSDRRLFDLAPESRTLRDASRILMPDVHYLDLRPEEQEVIRDALSDQLKAEAEAVEIQAEAAKAFAKEERKQKQREQQEIKREKKQAYRNVSNVERLRKNIGHLLKNLDFDSAAIERLALLDESRIGPVNEKLGMLNIGQINYRDSIRNTEPKTYEIKAGYDYRIYFCPIGTRFNVRLVGDKGTQDADLDLLRQ